MMRRESLHLGLAVLTHRRATRGPSTEDRLQESRIPLRILPVSDHRECQKKGGYILSSR